MKRKSIILIAAFILCIAPAAQADLYFEDITHWTGTGDNKAAMIIHWSAPEVFNNPYDTGGVTRMPAPVADRSMAWGYRYDGTPTGADMMMAIAAADPKLYVVASGSTAYGAAIFGIGYDVDGDGYGLTNTDTSTTYTQADFSNGWLGGMGYMDADFFVPTDADDLYWGGWYGANWELWHEQGGIGGFEKAPDRGEDTYYTPGGFFGGSHGEWDFSQVGISGITLEDGSWAGWSVAAGGLDMADPMGEGSVAWNEHKQAPMEPGTSPVPVPAAVWLLGSGLIGLVGIRRRSGV
jgi:hypothetical protein